jgi:glycosyltransferase involved in cell wall biosynthesis
MILKLGLQKRIILLGQVGKEKLLRLYQNATLFIFPSYYEGLPTALLEAMSCSVPIIATDVRGNRDIISHYENGILTPPKNPKKLAEAILILLNDEMMRRFLGKNARKTIKDKYTWNNISIKILECYQQILNKQI